jgi:hypothetical protein
MTARVLWLGVCKVEDIVLLVKRLWAYIDYLCEKYLKANKEHQ